MSSKLNTYKSKEKILCPRCFEPISIKSESIMKSNGYSLQLKSTDLDDFTKISCQKCSLNFTFIFCPFCEKKIYMKIHPKPIQYNGLNGYNIKCPYKSCSQMFYFTKCPKCNMVQKQKKYIKEGMVIECQNNECKFNYCQVNCPKKYCTDLVSFEKPKNFTNFPIGIMIIHKNEIMFQKINCYYCWRPIVYPSKQNHKNKYCECQKVECPYEDCKKTFNRIICPFCFEEIYINDGWYEMGSNIKCYKCKNSFGKILCPSCGKINTSINNYFKLGNMKCGFANCLKNNNMINCLYCRKLNIFDIDTQLSGQVIKCGYCKNTFNEIFCPFCEKTNPFPLADFSFGKVYKCQYLTCMKEFQFLICPKCHTNSFTKETQEGQKLKCEKCDTLFMNWGCPFCKSNIIDEDTTLQIGQMIKCPFEKCNKKYSFIRCASCKKLIFSEENENICGKAIKCPYQNCKSYTLMLYCPECEVRTIYTGKKSSLNEGESISCENCKKNYIFQKNNLLYQGNLKVLEQIEGRTIDFGVGQVDDNYLAIQELFFDDLRYKCPSVFESEYSDQGLKEKNYIVKNFNALGECIVCHNNLRESVFVPCGHRCACYNCAVIVYAVTKRCPRCNEEASCIIKKIYE